ncbi:hypothetical protein FHU33_0864 [Blastococcus colisei]|uniref:4-amino-4-deoxy-L-arabinose transferase-like glycosyltransferase n=1 Tax=Blastococcus colisei TaxID=1564162 RepID=A0A543PBN6_9ACTN|nr:hypothetical protein [Blastococcus colisei]TQN41496.1 hypothetical protein FHU33_0864 [Blastococcus colisei]
MTTATMRAPRPAPVLTPAPPGKPLRPGRWWPPLTMLGVVLAGVCAPLVRTPTFYFWDDTAGASVGAWRNIGDALLDGRLLLLDIEAWRGGNYAAEAAFGLYNPLLLGLYAGTRAIDDLALVTVVIKAFLFLTMALGAYLLCREYGARPWPAALLGSSLPLSGFTLWMDGAAWVTGLTVTALAPWVWYTARRAAEGRGSFLWAVLAGYLCASAGNPYGLLASGLVVAGVLAEALLRRRFRAGVGVTSAGIAVALLSVPTYLPFVLSASVSYRAGSQTFNDEFLSPELSDLVGLSSPSFTPYMDVFGELTFSFPGLYLAWYLLPLLPWLRWSVLRERVRGLAALWVVGVINLLLVLGPSQIWFFRWPVRLLPYLWLAVAVTAAVLLSAGLQRDRLRLRGALSGGLVFLGGWLAWSDVPVELDRHLFSTGLVAGLMAGLLVAAGRGARPAALVGMAGTLVVLAVQLSWWPSNANVLDYRFPRGAEAIQRSFADNGPGLRVQIGSVAAAGPDRGTNGVYEDVLFGSMYAVAGVESLTAYSGVGFTNFDVPLCTEYTGSTCPEAWDALWETPDGADERLADLIRAETVVVQRALRDTQDEPAPQGWQLEESTDYVDVWRRTEPLPWPEGRLSDTDGPVEIVSDTRVGEVGETVEFRRDGRGPIELTFARLAWPGYTAEIDGREVPVEQGPNGLLAVPIPEDVDAGTLTLAWSPPGTTLSLAAVGAAAVLVAGLTAAELRTRRSRRHTHLTPEDATGVPHIPERAPLPAGRTTRENQRR